MRSLLLLFALIILAAAQDRVYVWPNPQGAKSTRQAPNPQGFTDSIPWGNPRCKSEGWKEVDLTYYYNPTFTGVKKICVRNSYVDVCKGPEGVQACNNFYGQCAPVTYDWRDRKLYPTVATLDVPTICVSKGIFMASDVKVLVIAQVVIGFVLITVALALSTPTGKATPGATVVVVVVQGVVSMLLMFSYYYLNGLVQLGAAISAGALFRTRNAALTGVGILFLLSAFFWTTYRFGLGNMQQQSRFSAGLADSLTYENYCNQYYRGYFDFNSDINSIEVNPATGAWGYCRREWLAAELFFQIFAQLLLVLQSVAGIQALLYEAPVSTSGTEPTKQ